MYAKRNYDDVLNLDEYEINLIVKQIRQKHYLQNMVVK